MADNSSLHWGSFSCNQDNDKCSTVKAVNIMGIPNSWRTVIHSCLEYEGSLQSSKYLSQHCAYGHTVT
jgi:hypothetical protein